MAMTTDYVAIVSVRDDDKICTPGRVYGSNELKIMISKWGLWQELDEQKENAELNDEEWPDVMDIWILGFKMTWDYDEVLNELVGEEGLYTEEDIEEWKEQYGPSEVLGYAEQRAADDNSWYGDPDYQAMRIEHDGEDWYKKDALEIYETITRLEWPATEGVDVTDIELLPFVEWELSLYGGRTRLAS